METSTSDRPFDLAVYGATGFTGRQTTRKLWEAAQSLGLRLLIAGRSSAKLHELRKTLGGNAESLVGIFVADSADGNALIQLAGSTRVLVNNAGPYSKYAPLVIQACVVAGTDYVDITGETPFVRKMIDLHHENARSKKVRIIPFCGFDSVPSDYSAWYALNQWAKDFPNEHCESITTFFEARGGFNGGTIESAFTLAASGEIQKMQKDLTLLCPKDRPQPKAPDDRSSAQREIELRGWSAPFFMSPVNTRVVRRTQSLFASESAPAPNEPWSRFSYDEALLIRGPFAQLAARAMAQGMRVFSKGSESSRFSKWIRPLLPAPGEGPSEAQMNSGFMRLTTISKGSKGGSQTTEIKAKGDPGNRITVGILTQSALCLAIQRERESLPANYGILTPAYAFGGSLYQRLLDLGFEFRKL